MSLDIPTPRCIPSRPHTLGLGSTTAMAAEKATTTIATTVGAARVTTKAWGTTMVEVERAMMAPAALIRRPLRYGFDGNKKAREPCGGRLNPILYEGVGGDDLTI